MKDSLKYLKLWQKKRNELPVNDDQQSDWLGMQSLLDKHLPVTAHTVSKRSFHLKVLKMLPKLFITFSAAAMVYTVSHVIISHTSKHHHQHKLYRDRHSVPDSLAIDSLNADSVTNLRDSLNVAVKPAIASDSLTIHQDNNQQLNRNAAFAPLNPLINNNLISSSLNIKKDTSAKQQLITASLSLIKKNSRATLNTAKNKNITTNQPKNKLVTSFSKPGNSKAGNSYLSGVINSNYNSVNIYKGAKINHVPNYKTTNNEGTFNDLINNDDYEPLQATAPQLNFNKGFIINGTAIIKYTEYNVFQKASSGKSIKSKTIKAGKDRTLQIKVPGFSNFDWGILTGINSSGSFTPLKQNSNFYGSFPVDLYFGLFTTYNLNHKWAISLQTQFYSPQTINTNYTHTNASKVDSGQSLKITSSRKLYSINIPLHLVYKVTSNINIKGGPVLSIPIKQINTSNTLQPYSLKADTPYYAKITNILNSGKYTQKFNLDFSAGASVHVKRFIFEATYLKSLSGYPVVNDLGNYKSHNGTLQFSIGFQLNKSKK